MSAKITWPCLAALTLFLAACATQPGDTQPAAAQPAEFPADPERSASAMERKFQEAARSYRMVERDGKTLYCKREKVLGSTIPTLQCLSESQLRLQVENMEDLRDRMRSSSKCTLGRSGAGGGCGGS